jgi:hypothetical protein
VAAAELVGVVYMFFAMAAALDFFSPRSLIPDTMRLTAATVVVITAGVAVAALSGPLGAGARAMALVKLGEVAAACLIACWPAVALTKPISAEERRTVLRLLMRRRKAEV